MAGEVIVDGKPVCELSSSRLSEIVRYGKGTKKTRAAAQGELWRREQGQDGTRSLESSDEVNRLLTESKRR